MENSITFAELHTQFYQLSQDGLYTEALHLIESHRQLFERSDVFYHWRSCLQALLGEPQAAIHTLQEALAGDTWWPPVLLRDDPDYKSLQGLPEFEALVACCTEKFKDAQRMARPQRLVLEAEGADPAAPKPLLMCLHGRGGNLRTDFARWSSAPQLGWHTVWLGSSQVLSQDTFSWDDHALAEREVVAHFQQLMDSLAIDPQRVVLAGFSQAGGLVVRLVLNGLLPATGFIAVAPASLGEEDIEHLKHSTHLAGKRAVILAGKDDHPWIKTAIRLADMLRKSHIPCFYTAYHDLGHDFPPDFVTQLPEYLAFLTHP